MARAKRPPRARSIARKAVRFDEKLARARSRLLDLEPGGTRARPLEISTPSLVEPKARAVRCPRCDEPFDVESHEARSDGHGLLREAMLRCRQCGTRRSLWFRVIAPS
jgi:hypothetical protein